MLTTLVLPIHGPLSQSMGSPVDELELLLSSSEVELEDSDVVMSSVVVPNVVGDPVVGGGGGKPVVVSSTVVVPGSGRRPVVPPTPPMSVVSVRPQPDETRHSSVAILACWQASILRIGQASRKAGGVASETDTKLVRLASRCCGRCWNPVV